MSGVWLASYLVLWLVVFVLAFLLAGSLRQLGLMQLRLGDDPGALITDIGARARRPGTRLHRGGLGDRGARHALATAGGAEAPRLRLAGLSLVP